MEELYVGFLKEGVQKDMCKANSPMVLWNYCVEQQGNIFSMYTRDSFQLNGTNPHTMTSVYESKIYNMCEFGWYKCCHYFDDPKVSIFPFLNACLGSVLGPDKNKGNEITQWILK